MQEALFEVSSELCDAEQQEAAALQEISAAKSKIGRTKGKESPLKQ